MERMNNTRRVKLSFIPLSLIFGKWLSSYTYQGSAATSAGSYQTSTNVTITAPV
jgi:hypothetical protein